MSLYGQAVRGAAATFQSELRVLIPVCFNLTEIYSHFLERYMNPFCSLIKFIALGVGMMASSAVLAMGTVGCTLENNKVLTLTNLESSPTYHYGTAQKKEITLSAQSTNIKVYKGSSMFSGGGSSHVRFVNGAYSYVAYNGMGRGWEFVGLIVYKGTKVLMHKSCKNYNDALAIDINAINAPEDPAPDDFGNPPL